MKTQSDIATNGLNAQHTDPNLPMHGGVSAFRSRAFRNRVFRSRASNNKSLSRALLSGSFFCCAVFSAVTSSSLWCSTNAWAAPVQAEQAEQGEEKKSSENLKQIQPGLETIQKEKVQEIVSYLASDELAGRGTMTEGFEKAADYVAQRFEAAGLKPVEGDSYFSITKLPVSQTPSEGFSLQIAGKDVEGAQLLSGGPEQVSGQFSCRKVGLLDTLDEKMEGIAVVDAPERAGGRRFLAQLARLANRVRLAGGTALIVRVAEDSRWNEEVSRMKQPRQENERNRFMIPTMIVPDDLNLEEAKVSVQLPKQIRSEGEAKNVIAVLPGSDPELAKEYILFSAHLDHLPPRDSGEDRIFNGADDNATGVTAVICLAEAFAKLETRPKRSVLFMTFWGEESGLLGSKAFAAKPPVELAKIKANINIEMIGRPEAGAHDKVWVTGWEKSTLGALMVSGAAEVGVDVFEHPQFSSMLYARSDNYSLAEKGVIAHSFSAGSLHSDYHQVTDEWEKLELEHMASVIRGLMAGAYPIADGQLTPNKE